LELIINGELNNSGHKFEAGSVTELFITETGTMTTTSSMKFGSELMMFVEGTANIGGWDFLYGEKTEIYLLGSMEVANHWVLDGASEIETYFYVCNGEGLPTNIDRNTIIVEEDCGVLPVELMFFEATEINGNVVLNWATASETNSDFFTVERSIDGSSWESIAYVQSAGNSNTLINYSYTDTEVTEAVWYYRLKQTDFDGAFEYFNTIVVEVRTMNEFKVVKAEKAGNQVNIFANFEAGSQVMIFNAMGNLLSNKKFSNDSNVTSFYFPENSGVVLVNYVNQSSGKVSSTKVFIR
jgi:hypothetical protein